MVAPATRKPFPWVPLLTLTAASFVVVTSEFLPNGLLPQMARDLGVSEARIGFLVTILAGTVVVATPPLTALTRRVSRKRLLLATLIVFTVANLLAAFAPTYEVLAVSRVLSGAAIGLFWSVQGPYTALLVDRKQLAKGIAVTNSGGTAAFVLGIPVGAAVGQAFGWRTSFLLAALLVAVLTVVVAVTLPPVNHIQKLATGEISIPVYRDRTIATVAVICFTVLLIMMGQNVLSTYIVPWMLEVPGIPEAAVSPLLFAQGLAGAVGLLLAGRFGDRFPRSSLLIFLGGVLLAVSVMGAFGSVPGVAIAGMILWPLFFGGIPALLHARVLGTASPRVRDQAAAFLVVSFNIGIGGGAWLGGLLVDGLGVATVPWGEAAFIAVAMAFVIGTAVYAARSTVGAPLRSGR
jgi:MFS transporter, DHA1 family, inner membrane transport protein